MDISYRNTWLGEFKSVIFLAMGLIAMLQIPNMLPLLVFVFFILFAFNAFIKLGEVYFLKRTGGCETRSKIGGLRL